MKKKTSTITFHASHNYGSMLQAYALQQTLFKLGYDNEIINLRTERQRKVYRRISFKDVFGGMKPLVRTLLMAPYIKQLQKKYDLFEEFLSSSLKLTQEYHTLEELEKSNFISDCYISGGDQIWNTAPCDFDWSFYLPFVKSGRRISYAVSMGPKAETQVTQKDLVKEYLSKYDSISVREEGTVALVRSLVSTPVTMDLDPTLLLSDMDWVKGISCEPLAKGDYILLYVPVYKKEVYEMALYLSRKLDMPVVTTIFSHREWKYPFKRYLNVGPWEFLNLVKNAKLVVSGSFHALVFSTIFHTPFFAVNGDKDNRMVTFLKNMNLLNRTINKSDREEKLKIAFTTDYSGADEFIEENKKNSLVHLKEMIEG